MPFSQTRDFDVLVLWLSCVHSDLSECSSVKGVVHNICSLFLRLIKPTKANAPDTQSDLLLL